MYFIVGISLLLFSRITLCNSELKQQVKFIKSKPPSVSGLLGTAYIADKSRHPV